MTTTHPLPTVDQATACGTATTPAPAYTVTTLHLGGDTPCEEPSLVDCGQPAGGCGDCGEPKAPADLEVDESSLSPAARGVRHGFYTALEVCFDELQTEPRNIVVIGGCRQRDMARRLGFMLPYSRIFVVDTDATQVEKARDEIRCRFKFAHAPQLSDLSQFESESVDLVMAHSWFEYVAPHEDWRKTVGEVARIIRPGGFLLASTYRPYWGKWLGGTGVREGMATLGCQVPVGQASYPTFLKELRRYTVVKIQVQPFPWQMAMCHKAGLDY